MADVRLLIQEEGRAARNLVAFNVPVSTNNIEKVTRKPPSIPRVAQSSPMKRSIKSTARVRSASTGRDRKSELQARYWAFLFGNLQRAVDGIYQTCEEDENISECKEVILVLENYTRDFHSLIEWFKVKWAYESSPPPLRRTPLAWEVRKTSPCRMWNSSTVPKSTSPLQRMSPTGPTCGSPIDMTIVEDTPISGDNKMNVLKEESGYKTVKDNKNSVSKNCTKGIRDESKILINKEINPVQKRVKSISTKVMCKTITKSPSSGKVEENQLGINESDQLILCKTKTNSTNSIKQCKSDEDMKILKHADVMQLKNPDHLHINNKEKSRTNDSINDSVNEMHFNKCSEIQKESDIHMEETYLETVNNEINTSVNLLMISESKDKTIKELNDTKIDSSVINKTTQNKNIEKANGKENAIQIMKRSKIVSTPKKQFKVDVRNGVDNKLITKSTLNKATVDNVTSKECQKPLTRPAYSTVSRGRPATAQTPQTILEVPKIIRSKTTLGVSEGPLMNTIKPGTSVMMRRKLELSTVNKDMDKQGSRTDQSKDLSGSVEVLTKQAVNTKPKDEGDGWQTVRSRYRRGSSHNLNMSTRFHKPSTAISLPALSIKSPNERSKKNCLTPDGNQRSKMCVASKAGKNMNNEVEKVKIDSETNSIEEFENEAGRKIARNLLETNSTSMIAAVFKTEAELLEKRIQQFMTAQAERERIILEEERKTEEADSQRSQQLSDEEAFLQRQIMELECADIDIDTETDETDGELVLEIEEHQPLEPLSVVTDDISLEDRYENMLEGMSWAERMDTLAQLQALVARHPGRALELHQKLSSPSRKRSLPETLRRYQAKQACAQHKRQKLLMEKSQRLRDLLNKVEDVKSAKNQLIEDKRIRMEMKLKRAEENRTQHLLEVVRKAHDEDSKLKEIAFINELEAQNKRHDFMALCQEQEERLQGIHDERQRRQEEKAAKEAAAEERRRALEAERQLRIQKMRQARREREERIGKMQLEREKERQELAREKARDREERLSALHAAQLANQEELQKKIAQKQQESARRHGENIEHIRQRAVESSILRSEEVPPTLKSYPTQKQCSLCNTLIPNEVYLLSHLKGKTHLEAVRKMHDGREPPRDELQRFNIGQIRDIVTLPVGSNKANDSKAAKEKQKAIKRRCRKIKQRMTTRGQEWEDLQRNDATQTVIESANKAKFRRNLKELDKLCSVHAKTAWTSVATSSLERCLGEIARAFCKSSHSDQDAFRSLNGFDTLTNLLNLVLNTQNGNPSLPNKSIVSLCRVYKSSVEDHSNNIEAVLMSNKILVILDVLLHRFEAVTALDDHTQAQETSNNATGNGSAAAAAMQLLCSLVPEVPFEKAALQNRLQDIVGYLVIGGLLERVSRHGRALVETDFFLEQERESSLLTASFDLLARLCCHLKRCNLENVNHSENNIAEQTTASSHLLNGLATSESAGAVGALYAALALTSQNQKGSSPTPNQAGPSASGRVLAMRGLKLLRLFAEMDLEKFQSHLGAESTSLQWRLIASHLITRLSRDSLSDKSEAGSPPGASGPHILAELFTVLGYFAVNNPENQLVLQSAGAGPSVLQQLCTLPFPFYGDPRLAVYTLPTLLVATYNNPEATAVLSCELSYQLLEVYKSSEEGKQNPLVQLLKDPTGASP
ncbi:S phase cyclin A-associated protein in the endoplasmic reticulum [Orussus abietinus]|uniref:S phase cyclin A-associated protein in the endoplasmic reticulum n=1 Tax=Orussus abietinus TaxID=222816 RepID=UPI0006263143|nr:S phase cyclin A-associated protein in the endoplasmic reticulum [Orussus abietinus]